MFGLKQKTFLLVVLFTVVEAIILAVWLSLARNGENVLSFVVLLLGLFVEHVLAAIAGKAEGA